LKKMSITQWTVAVNDNHKYIAVDLLQGEITKQDLAAEGWKVIGCPSFAKAQSAIDYCKQMGFEPVIRKRVRL